MFLESTTKHDQDPVRALLGRKITKNDSRGGGGGRGRWAQRIPIFLCFRKKSENFEKAMANLVVGLERSAILYG